MQTLKQKLSEKFNNKKAQIAAGGGLLAASGVASADVTASINTAFSTAQSNLGLVVSGVILLVAVATGVGLIVKFMSH